MINTLFLWVTVTLLALLIETGFPGLFYFLSLALGSLIAALLSLFDVGLTTQLLACLTISCVSLYVLRLFVAHDNQNMLKTNIDGLIGQKIMLLEAITTTKPGTAKLYGDIWLVREKQGKEIEAGHEVTITAVEGCHLIVKK